MRPFTLVEASPLRRLAYPALVLSLLAAAACTLLLDRSSTGCQFDSDCEKFGVHPSCQNGACVDTGIPCFAGQAETEPALLNACVPGSCLPFDDCARVGLCGDAMVPSLLSPNPQVIPNLAPDAGAAPAMPPMCSDLTKGQMVPVVTGSSNFPTLLDSVAPLIAQGAGQLQAGPRFIWQTTSSCQAANSIWNMDPGAGMIHDPVLGSNPDTFAKFYDNGKATSCLLGPAGMKVTVGESDVYASTCNVSYVTSQDISDRPGPVQAMAFVVPTASSQVAISQNAAYEVFGLGGNGQTQIPWTNPFHLYVRSKSTGTQQMIGKEINVPADQFWGIDQHSAAQVDQALRGLLGKDAEQSIGLLSVSVYDADRPNLKALAYRRTNQTCAYLPDSTIGSFDKANVRDGHYPIWGPLHFFTSATTTNAEAALLGNSPSLAFATFFAGDAVNPDVLDAFIDARLVPRCAMSVTQSEDAELSPLEPFVPSRSCACYFLAKTGIKTDEQPGQALPPECKRCNSDSECPASRPACLQGFCEPPRAS